MMNKVTLSGHILVPPNELPLVRDALTEHTKLTREEDGCVAFIVTEDLNVEGRFNVYEEFTTPKAFRAHQERVKESAWGEATTNTQRFYSIEGL